MLPLRNLRAQRWALGRIQPWHGARRLAAALLFVSLLAVLAGQSAEAAHTPNAVRITNSPCGTVRRPPPYRHVVWIMLENEGDAVIGSRSAPYLNSLSASCGLATNVHAEGHPSLPNYIALTSGSTDGITDDGKPGEHPLETSSLFGQLKGDWRALEESMPRPCDRVTSGRYAARHNPAVYYRDLGATCAKDDVPLTEPLDLSAAFTFITPNICDDMHSCPIATGDAWLARIVPLILNSTQYRSHSLVLVITFDENDHDETNQIPVYVVAPSVRRGARANGWFSDYSVLRTTEQLLHLPFLGGAKTAPSMLKPLNL